MKKLFCTGIASFALALALAGCGGEKKQAGTIPTLDLEAAIDNPRTFDLSEIAESIEFIPLDDSEVMVGGIMKIEESENGFFITHNTGSSDRTVLFFDKTGKFVAQKGSIGRGPGEYLRLVDMAVDYENDNVYLLASFGGAYGIIAFDTAGRIFARVDLAGYDGNRISYHDGKVVLLNEWLFTPQDQADRYTLVETFSTDLRPEGSIETEWKGDNAFTNPNADMSQQRSSGISVNHVLSNNGDRLIVKEGRSDTVFYRKGNTLEPAYKLDLGAYSIPSEVDGEDRMKYYEVYGIYESGNHILIQVKTPGFGIINTGMLLFDRNDLSNGFSMKTPDGLTQLSLDGIRSFSFDYSVRGNRFVYAINALEILRHRDNITNPDLKALAAGLREESNPVIVVVNLKR
jgi:hypothetical protein